MSRFSFFNRPPVLFFTLTFTVWLLATEVKAQTPEAPAANSAMTKGAWAMQFQINQNFTLSSFQGATLSLKRHYSPSKALRFGLNLGGGFSNEKSRSEFGSQAESDGNNQNLGFACEYIVYPSSDSRAKFFFGTGPSVNFSRSKNTESQGNTQPLLRSINKNTIWSTGFSGVIGVEWFANSQISFLAQYSSFLGYSSARGEAVIEQADGAGGFSVSSKSFRNVDGFNFRASAVNFGLSVYF